MISHTQAFADYRELSQAHIDFVVVVCHAVPSLRADIMLPNSVLSHAPDHFEQARNPKNEIANNVGRYQDELARTNLITIFSYFEGYVKDALKEIVSFHGGIKDFTNKAETRSKRFLSPVDAAVIKSKRKLQDRFTKSKISKYQKHIQILENKGFNFPSDLLSHFGMIYLSQKLDDKRGMRAWEIPVVLEECLLIELTKDDKEHFESVRSIRNKIAHGKPPNLTLKDSLYHASLLRTFAAKIDRHITEHFLVIQDT